MQLWYVVMAYKNPKVPNNMFITNLKGVYESLINKALILFIRWSNYWDALLNYKYPQLNHIMWLIDL